MFSFVLRPEEICFLRFEDVNYINNKCSFKIYRNNVDFKLLVSLRTIWLFYYLYT